MLPRRAQRGGGGDRPAPRDPGRKLRAGYAASTRLAPAHGAAAPGGPPAEPASPPTRRVICEGGNGPPGRALHISARTKCWCGDCGASRCRVPLPGGHVPRAARDGRRRARLSPARGSSLPRCRGAAGAPHSAAAGAAVLGSAARRVLPQTEQPVREVGQALLTALLGAGQVGGQYRASAGHHRSGRFPWAERSRACRSWALTKVPNAASSCGTQSWRAVICAQTLPCTTGARRMSRSGVIAALRWRARAGGLLGARADLAWEDCGTA